MSGSAAIDSATVHFPGRGKTGADLEVAGILEKLFE